jgi:hypothetical protein
MPDQGHKVTTSVTIANGQTDSGVLWCGDYAQVILVLPAEFTGSTIGFKVCGTADGTFVTLYDKTNTAMSLTVTQNRAYPIPIDVFPAAFLKLVSGSSEGADRAITVLAKY